MDLPSGLKRGLPSSEQTWNVNGDWDQPVKSQKKTNIENKNPCMHVMYNCWLAALDIDKCIYIYVNRIVLISMG